MCVWRVVGVCCVGWMTSRPDSPSLSAKRRKAKPPLCGESADATKGVKPEQAFAFEFVVDEAVEDFLNGVVLERGFHWSSFRRMKMRSYVSRPLMSVLKSVSAVLSPQ